MLKRMILFIVAEQRAETMKTRLGTLPACLASVKDRMKKPGALEAMRTQGFSEEH